jgi:hypothetical protein
VSCYGRQFLFI